MSCSRRSLRTGRPCKREAAEWPTGYEDLPPVESCHSHMSDAEWAQCLEARKRRNAEGRGRWEEWERQLAEREARGEVPPPAVQREPVPCSGRCMSKEKARLSDSDSAIWLCANCDGYVCLRCQTVRTDDMFQMCGPCEKKAYQEYAQDAEAEMDHGPDPAGALADLVNQLAKATGISHRDVNVRINRAVGVRTRVGAEEPVIRRAVWVAREWLRKEQG